MHNCNSSDSEISGLSAAQGTQAHQPPPAPQLQRLLRKPTPLLETPSWAERKPQEDGRPSWTPYTFIHPHQKVSATVPIPTLLELRGNCFWNQCSRTPTYGNTLGGMLHGPTSRRPPHIWNMIRYPTIPNNTNGKGSRVRVA